MRRHKPRAITMVALVVRFRHLAPVAPCPRPNVGIARTTRNDKFLVEFLNLTFVRRDCGIGDTNVKFTPLVVRLRHLAPIAPCPRPNIGIARTTNVWRQGERCTVGAAEARAVMRLDTPQKPFFCVLTRRLLSDCALVAAQLSTVQKPMVKQDTRSHRFTDRYGAYADARIVSSFRANIDLFSARIHALSRG